MSQTKKDLKLVEVHGQKLTVTSLVVSELFGRKHSHVLRSIEKFGGEYGIVPTSYTDLHIKKNLERQHPPTGG